MAYDETLADRIRRSVGPRADVTEKKMFGGTRTEKAIKRWVDQGAAFVATLDGGATKKPKKARASKR
jgi:uncharacterized protein (DUF1786 family)